MNKILDEKFEFQKDFLNFLVTHDGYELRDAKTNYDREFACDRELLFRFLEDTQPEKMDALRKIYKSDTENTIINFINTEVTKPRGSLLDAFKHGVEISNITLDLMYTKPATTFNQNLISKYEKNVFSVMEEVVASEEERVDVVIFLNGFAIFAFELKSNPSGQDFHNAIRQYREDRNPNTRLFLFKAGVFVCFAMDLNEVYMTTKLCGTETQFLPFNMGRGTGVNTGAGNPTYKDKLSVYYMWEDILTKDTVLDLISRFMFIETKESTDEVTEKKVVSENLIFPRYHQLDLIRKLLADLQENLTSQNYLIEHSAGSGKTNSIAWLAHRLTSLHDSDNNIIFDNVIVVTDRVVVDRQLQKAVMGIEHKSGLVRVMDSNCTSTDLGLALTGNTKIIVTTIQKFPFIVDSVKDLNSKKFAVIIDEAHSSTTGKDMAALTQTLGSDDQEPEDIEDIIADKIRKTGKQHNVSMFAFTATPKPTTLQLFGRVNKKGQKEAFHLYSMKQAIEEEFILDVLENYTTYQTLYHLNKQIEGDPKYNTSAAKRKIARFAALHDTNISQRIEIIVEHFRTSVMPGLGGRAKAMVVTSSRQEAVKYRQALDKYIESNGYDDIHALVAFSGKVTLPDEDAEYTEVGMNGNIPESSLPYEFDKDMYNVLLVANKYQTGFDQPKLCAMYILKPLSGVNAVQTLSRLNRICPPYDKTTFILDFKNSYDDIINSFKPYYTTTLLSNSVTPSAVYDLEAKIDGYYILDPNDIDTVAEILLKTDSKITAKEKRNVLFYFNKAADTLKKHPLQEQKEFVRLMRNFVRFYEFLIQATSFEDIELHKKYIFIRYFLPSVNIDSPGNGFSLEGKIRATNFMQKKTGEHKKTKMIAQPIVQLPTAEAFGITEEMEKQLSEIIDEINSKMGKEYGFDTVTMFLLQVIAKMAETDKLKANAKNNTVDEFRLVFFNNISDALVDVITQNQSDCSQNEDLCNMLLSHEDLIKQFFEPFVESTYNKLRQEDDES